MFLYFYNILIKYALKKFLTITVRVLLSLLATVLLIWLLLQTELVQKFYSRKGYQTPFKRPEYRG